MRFQEISIKDFFVTLLLTFSITHPWPWSQQEEEQYKCMFAELGGTIPDRACSVRDFLIKTKKIMENNPRHEEQKIELSKIQFHNAYLFYGSAGTGKTTAAKSISSEADVEVEYHRADEIRQKIYEKGGEPSVVFNEIYEHAHQTVEKKGKPVLVIIDDIEKFSANKGYVTDAIFGSLSCQLDKHLDNPYITTICISNNLKILEHAFLTRCIKIQWRSPQVLNREAIIRFYSKKNNITLSESDTQTIEELAKKTKDFAGRDFKLAFHESSKIAAQEELSKDITLAYVEKGIKLRQKEIDDEKKGLWDVAKKNPEASIGIATTVVGIIYYLVTGKKSSKLGK